MPKLIVSIDGVVIKDMQLTRERQIIGRRPYCDVVIDNLAVSGEHAAIHLAEGRATLEDLGSTNGT
jgi:pSer/pThr/pTyr-binding forkhead associated (FHA) protein